MKLRGTLQASRPMGVAVMLAVAVALTGCAGRAKTAGPPLVDTSTGRTERPTAPIPTLNPFDRPPKSELIDVALEFSESPSCRLLRVRLRGGDNKVRVQLPDGGWPCELDLGKAVWVADFNFDDRLDVAVLKAIPVANGLLYDFWLQEQNGDFFSSEVLDEVELFSPRLDSVAQTLSSTTRLGYGVSVDRTYAWEGDALVLVTCEIEVAPEREGQPDVPSGCDVDSA